MKYSNKFLIILKSRFNHKKFFYFGQKGSETFRNNFKNMYNQNIKDSNNFRRQKTFKLKTPIIVHNIKISNSIKQGQIKLPLLQIFR